MCTFACPLGIDIPGFIRAIRENESNKALSRIKEHNLFASICGRLCPAPCEKACVFEPEGSPIGIRALERFASDYGRERGAAIRPAKSTGKKVAIIGSGPAGLSAGIDLTLAGHQVTIFESLPLPGGILRYGVPEFRLPNKIVESEITFIKSLGVEIKTNFLAGQSATIEEIKGLGFSAVFLATGAGSPQLMDIPGTHLGGVCYAEEFLMRVNLFGANLYPKNDTSPHVGRRIVVVGDGYAALDCARTAIRLGREVTVVFSHTEDDMPVRPQEKEYGKEEGVKLEPLAKLLAVMGNGNNFVSGVKCIRMDFADPHSTGKWKLVPVAKSEFTIEADSVIFAIGHRPMIKRMLSGLKVNTDGTVWTNEGSMTSVKGVFAGGNLTKSGSIVEAMASGKRVAGEIDRYLKT